MFSQDTLFKKMEAFGYSSEKQKGHSYGLSQMAVKAFIQGEIETFQNKLMIIKQLTSDDILKLEYAKRDHDLPIKLDSGQEIIPAALFGFFDDISFSQKSDEFEYLLIEKTSDEDCEDLSKCPVKVDMLCGVYTIEELSQLFTTLEENFSVPFAINLTSTHHSLSIHFDVSQKRWIVICPSYLPGDNYPFEASDKMAETVMRYFSLGNKVVSEYCTANLIFYVEENSIRDFNTLLEELKNVEPLNTLLCVTVEKGNRRCCFHSGWLSIAAHSGNTAIAQQLIAQGDDVNQLNDEQKSPLYYASQFGNIDIVQKLIEAKANINQPDHEGLTPLHIASQKGHIAVAKLLIEHNADLDKLTKAGLSPLVMSCINNQFDMVKLLIESGATIDPNLSEIHHNLMLAFKCISNIFNIPDEKLRHLSFIKEMCKHDNAILTTVMHAKASFAYDILNQLPVEMIKSAFLGKPHEYNKGALLLAITKTPEDKDAFIHFLKRLPEDDRMKILMLRNKTHTSLLDDFYQDRLYYKRILNEVVPRYQSILDLRKTYAEKLMNNPSHSGAMSSFLKSKILGIYDERYSSTTIDDILRRFDPSLPDFGIKKEERVASKVQEISIEVQNLKQASPPITHNIEHH